MSTSGVAYPGFFNGGGSVTSHHDDVKILHYNYSSLEQWFSTWGPRTPKWSANDFKGAARSKGSTRGPPKC